jgi:hypothetical protein
MFVLPYTLRKLCKQILMPRHNCDESIGYKNSKYPKKWHLDPLHKLHHNTYNLEKI